MPTPEPDSALQKKHMIAGLTGIRGYAILAVMLLHFLGVRADMGYDLNLLRYVHIDYLSHLAGFGWYGVDMFFILSGFIISYHYRQWFTGSLRLHDMRRFLYLRLIRIYPAYAFSLLVLIVYKWAGIWDNDATQYKDLIGHATLTYAWGFYGDHETWNKPGWSLSCEFFSYLCFPFLVALAGRCARQNRPGNIIVVMLLAALALHLVGTFTLFGPLVLARGSLNFLLGYLVFLLYRSLEGKNLAWATLAGCALMAGFITCNERMPIGPAAIAVCLIVLGLAQGKQPGHAGRLAHALFANRFMVFTGTVSYSIYIIHYPVLIALREMKNAWFGWLDAYVGDVPVMLAVMLAASACIYLAAAGLYYGLEKPAIAYGKRRLQRLAA